jgi:hypothetical protein
MTGTPAHGREPAESWLADGHRALLDGLGRFTDLSAGMQEITTLHAGHAGLLAALDGTLDTEAGLAGILPSPAPASPAAPRPPGTAVAEAIEAADPAVRVALRRHPVTLAAILSNLTVQALTIGSEIFTADAVPRARVLTDDLGRALALALARGFDPDLDRALEHALDRALVYARALDRDLTRARGLDRPLDDLRAAALDLDLDRNLDRARALAGVLARGVVRTLDHAVAFDLDLDLTLARDRAVALGRDIDLSRDPGFDRDLVSDRLRGRARALDHQTALVVGSALGTHRVKGLAAVLLTGALDDFTRADLTKAGLADRDLPGVRWSERDTRWPPGTDLDRLRALSREVAPGIYVIAKPGDSDKSLHQALI